MKRSLHRTFKIWPVRLIAVSLIIILVTLTVAPVSIVFIGVALGLGMLDSLSTMEELTGGREIFLFSIPVLLAGDFFLQLILFEPTTIAEKVALYIQFASVIVLTESTIVFLAPVAPRRVLCAKSFEVVRGRCPTGAWSGLAMK